jgi:hypothetical protein
MERDRTSCDRSLNRHRDDLLKIVRQVGMTAAVRKLTPPAVLPFSSGATPLDAVLFAHFSDLSVQADDVGSSQ